jgi:hypothetical protein
MKPLLKQYLAWGIAAQFLAASVVYIGGLIFINCYGNMGIKLPAITSMIISIGPWAFLWPFAVWLLTVILLDKVRTERMLLHLFGGMMVAAVIILVVVSVDFALPFMGVLVVDVGNNGE